MTDHELEEFRYDVATYLLDQMSEGSRYQYAHDKMLSLLQDRSEERLREYMPVRPVKSKKTAGKGFSV